jgi:hypothetical protein
VVHGFQSLDKCEFGVLFHIFPDFYIERFPFQADQQPHCSLTYNAGKIGVATGQLEYFQVFFDD